MAPTIGDFFTAVPGMIHATTIPAAVGEILVRNDSPYDLWIAYNNAPSAPPSPLTFSQYAAEVTPGREQIVPPPLFNGRMWIGCYNPGGKAASGTISSRANVYVRWYPVGESAGVGAAYSALTGLDSTSQQRVISIPTEPHIASGFLIALTGLGVSDLLAAPIAFNPGGANAWDGVRPVTVYVYAIKANMQQYSWVDLAWEICEINGSNAIIAEHEIVPRMRIFAEQRTRDMLPPGLIVPSTFSPLAAATVVDLGVRIFGFGQGGAGVNQALFVGSFWADCDLTGQTAPPAIGNGAGTPPGAIY